MNKLILILFIILTVSCTSSNDFDKAKSQLEAQGYTSIENTGYSLFCCGEDDSFSTGFKAVDSKGSIIEGCICSSIGKGITIRFK